MSGNPLSSKNNGIQNRAQGLGITYNGTFLQNYKCLPSIGYFNDVELKSNKVRKKYGLPDSAGEMFRDDPKGLSTNFLSRDAGLIKFKCTVSTDEDQIAIVPGTLKKEWKEEGRRYFQYSMDSPITNLYTILSAKYQVEKGKWKDVDIEILYHQGHEYNLDRMIRSVEASLNYYSENFSDYPDQQVRIVEFPRYALFAQSFPGTIPYSEGLGFITKVEEPTKGQTEQFSYIDSVMSESQMGQTLDKIIDFEDLDEQMDFDISIDYPFYITAHEMAHQWFPHQIGVADVEGANMLSETIAQYAALMVMKKEYAQPQLKKIMRYELNSYLTARKFGYAGEKPLAIANPDQQHILYRKGAVVMWGLSNYLGEDSVNAAIRKFLKVSVAGNPPYSSTLIFLECLQERTPDSLSYILSDWFEDIIVYDNGLELASSRKIAGDKYLLSLDVVAKKYRSDGEGNETQIGIKDYIPIVVYGEQDSIIYSRLLKVIQENTKLQLTLSKPPKRVGVDPEINLVDRNLRNNQLKVVKDNY